MSKLEIIMGVSIILVVISVFLLSLNSMKLENTYIRCCNNQPCSDTYYTAEDNKCHLSLCEQSPFTNKSQCIYDGANITLTGGLKNE